MFLMNLMDGEPETIFEMTCYDLSLNGKAFI